jgi:dTDP-4-amino-4,6-dideoxygalactose transaminase
MGFNVNDFPQAEQYYKRSISLPIFPAISQEQLAKVVDELSLAISLQKNK